MSERAVLEVCPSCFSTLHGVRGFAPNLAEQPMGDALNWPECRDPWHEDRRDGLKTCFAREDMTPLSRTYSSQAQG